MEKRFIVIEVREDVSLNGVKILTEINLQMEACYTIEQAEKQIEGINKKEPFARTYAIKNVYFK